MASYPDASLSLGRLLYKPSILEHTSLRMDTNADSGSLHMDINADDDKILPRFRLPPRFKFMIIQSLRFRDFPSALG
jgi:hypothetical protein